MAKTTDALKIIDRMIGDDPEMREGIAREMVICAMARAVYDARNAAGLSHEDLARLVGVEPSVIDDIEESDYGGDTLPIVQRIADALGAYVEVRLVPLNDPSDEDANLSAPEEALQR